MHHKGNRKANRHRYKIVPMHLPPHVLAVLDALAATRGTNRTREASRAILEAGERTGAYAPEMEAEAQPPAVDSAQPP